MAATTTVEQVRELIDIDAPDDAIKHNYIKTANVIVEQHFAGVTIASGVVAEIEKYLAAHFASLYIERGSMIRDTVGDETMEWAENFGEGLRSTRFGQTALSLDYTGTLASVMSPKLKAVFRVT